MESRKTLHQKRDLPWTDIAWGSFLLLYVVSSSLAFMANAMLIIYLIRTPA